MLKSCLGKFFKIVCDFNLQASVFNVRVAIRGLETIESLWYLLCIKPKSPRSLVKTGVPGFKHSVEWWGATPSLFIHLSFLVYFGG